MNFDKENRAGGFHAKSEGLWFFFVFQGVPMDLGSLFGMFGHIIQFATNFMKKL